MDMGKDGGTMTETMRWCECPKPDYDVNKETGDVSCAYCFHTVFDSITNNPMNTASLADFEEGWCFECDNVQHECICQVEVAE